MSETRLDIGKLKPINLQGKTIEEWCKEQIGPLTEGLPLGVTYYDYYSSECEDFEDYIFNFSDNTIWMIEKEISKAAYEDIQVFHTNADGSISYTAVYYDGGTCINEILEDFIKNNKI